MHNTSLDEDLRRCAAQGDFRKPLPERAGESPGDRDLVRFGRALSLDIHQTLGLVLKGQWESFLRKALGRSTGWEEEVSRGPRRNRRRQDYWSHRFYVGAGQAADGAGLFELFEAEGHYATQTGYDREAFESLVHHCVLLGLHRVSTDGPEVAAFIGEQRVQRALLFEASPEERGEYWRKHCEWRELEDEVGILLLELESQALENERVQQGWTETFGTAYLDVLEAEARCGALQRRLHRKLENPELTEEDLDRFEAEDQLEQEREIAKIRRSLARARRGYAAGPGGMPMPEAELWEYEEDCKDLLREIYRLTHPDAVGQHDFTEAQKEFLTACYRDAVACGNPGGVEDEEVSLGMRFLDSLRAILNKARKVWQSMGLAWNEGAAVRGETLVERIAWLDARIAELEEEARDVKAELFVVASDPDVREKRASMASKGVTARVTAALESRARELASQADEFERRLEQFLQQEERP